MPRARIPAEMAVIAAKEAFSTEVKVQRVRCNMSQKELAEFTDVDPSVMSRLMGNPDKISVGRLRSIIHALGIQPAVILRLLGYTDKEIKQLPEVV